MTRMLLELLSKGMPLESAMAQVMARALRDGLAAAHRHGLDGLVDKAGCWSELEGRMTAPMGAYADRDILREASRHKRLGVKRDTLEQAAKREAARFTKRWYRYIRNTTANRMWDLKDVVGPELERGAAPLFGRSRAELIAGNEAARLNDIGNLMVYNLAGVAREFWHTQEDGKVDDMCERLSGRVFPVGEGPRPVTGTHLKCRCERLPVIQVAKSAQEAVGPNAGKGGMIFGEDPDPEMAAHDMSSKVGDEELAVIHKQGPPRPGLVPESGDPKHPFRWIRPSDDAEVKPDEEGTTFDELKDYAAGKSSRHGLIGQDVDIGSDEIRAEMRRIQQSRFDEWEYATGGELDYEGTLKDRGLPKELFKGFSGVTYDPEKFKGDFLSGATAVYEDGRIYVNPDERTILMHPEEWIPGRSPIATAFHEFGHHVERSYLSVEQRQKWDALHTVIWRASAKWDLDDGLQPGVPTYYSMSTMHEFFADVFMLSILDGGSQFFTENPEVADLLKAHGLWGL